MSLFKSIKRALKNQRRRNRVKGTARKSQMFGGAHNVAQTLILAWTGPPKGRGIPAVSAANIRAAKRLVNHKRQWDDTPEPMTVSRQVSRAAVRVWEKQQREFNVSGIPLAKCI